MIQVSSPVIIAAVITVIGAIITAIIGASKYGKRKAETNLFAELRNSTSAMLDSSRETIIDLRATIEYVRAERETMHEERNKMREQRDKAIEERDKAIEELNQFKKDFQQMKDIVQTNTVEIALIKEGYCAKAKKCEERKLA